MRRRARCSSWPLPHSRCVLALFVLFAVFGRTEGWGYLGPGDEGGDEGEDWTVPHRFGATTGRGNDDSYWDPQWPPVNCPNNCTSVEHGTCQRTLSEDEWYLDLHRGQCHCNDGWEGDDCSERSVLVFPHHLCSGHGWLKDNGDCDCFHDWERRDCSLGPTSTCLHNCSGHGQCWHANCHCDAGFAGEDCSRVVGGQCPNNCTARGVCNDITAQCTCFDGFGGVDCSVGPLKDSGCLGNCSGRGQCVNASESCEGLCTDSPNNHGMVCRCQRGFTGDACDLVAPSCPDNCTGHGLCWARAAVCQCEQGFAALNCEQGPHYGAMCPANCSGHGDCVDGECFCHVGFNGTACEKVVSTCLHSCSGRGTCNRGVCTCNSPFRGEDCSVGPSDPDTCPSHCSGKGMCNEETGECHCFPGYTGAACDQLHATHHACPANCSAHGVCLPSGTCNCSAGYQREAHCSFGPITQLCANNCSGRGECLLDCLEDGRCVNSSCSCFPPYFGPTCEHQWSQPNQTTCNPPCVNGSLCVNGECLCDPPCTEGICTRNGTCVALCDPPQRFVNGSCQDVCDPPCPEGARCVNGECECFPPCDAPMQCVGGECVCPDGMALVDGVCELVCDPPCEVGECVNGTCVGPPSTAASASPPAPSASAPPSPSPAPSPEDEDVSCPYDCYLHGSCILGICVCDQTPEERYEPPYCEIKSKRCPRDCTGKGVCRSGVCACFNGWTGVDCDHKIDRCSWDCSTHGCGCLMANGSVGVAVYQPSGTGDDWLVAPAQADGGALGDVEKGMVDADDAAYGMFERVVQRRNEEKGLPVAEEYGKVLPLTEKEGGSPNQPSVGGDEDADAEEGGGEGEGEGGGAQAGQQSEEDKALKAAEGMKANSAAPKRCPNDCSGHGTCRYGVCMCDIFPEYKYSGEACEIVTLGCGRFDDCMQRYGHGACNNGTCYCERSWTGDRCHIPDLDCPRDCSRHGVCDRLTGICTCDEGAGYGYGGDDCSLDICKKPPCIWGMGRAYTGALALDNLNTRREIRPRPIWGRIRAPRLVRRLMYRDVDQVVCGFDHAFAFNKKGEVYGFGRNDKYQLGVGDNKRFHHKPIQLKFFGKAKQIKMISTSRTHTLALTTDGDVLAWGSTEAFALGTVVDYELWPRGTLKSKADEDDKNEKTEGHDLLQRSLWASENGDGLDGLSLWAHPPEGFTPTVPQQDVRGFPDIPNDALLQHGDSPEIAVQDSFTSPSPDAGGRISEDDDSANNPLLFRSHRPEWLNYYKGKGAWWMADDHPIDTFRGVLKKRGEHLPGDPTTSSDDNNDNDNDQSSDEEPDAGDDAVRDSINNDGGPEYTSLLETELRMPDAVGQALLAYVTHQSRAERTEQQMLLSQDNMGGDDAKEEGENDADQGGSQEAKSQGGGGGGGGGGDDGGGDKGNQLLLACRVCGEIKFSYKSVTIPNGFNKKGDELKSHVDGGSSTDKGVCEIKEEANFYERHANRLLCPQGTNRNFAQRFTMKWFEPAEAHYWLYIGFDAGLGAVAYVDDNQVWRHDRGIWPRIVIPLGYVKRGEHKLDLYGAENCCDGQAGWWFFLRAGSWAFLNPVKLKTLCGIGGGCKFGLVTQNYGNNYVLQVCGYGHASSRERIAGWCEIFTLDPQPDGTFGLYTEILWLRFYLKVCGMNNASSREKVGGWCEKFRFDDLGDNRFGIWTQAGANKYYLKICGFRHASSREKVGGWCEIIRLVPVVKGCDARAIVSGKPSCDKPEPCTIPFHINKGDAEKDCVTRDNGYNRGRRWCALEKHVVLTKDACKNAQSYTPNKYQYQWIVELDSPSAHFHVRFEVKAANDAHVALSTGGGDKGLKFEFPIGGWRNLLSQMRFGKQCCAMTTVFTPGIVHPHQWRWFWLSYNGENGEIRAGRGMNVNSAMFARAWIPGAPKFKQFGISTGWGSSGDWRNACMVNDRADIKGKWGMCMDPDIKQFPDGPDQVPTDEQKAPGIMRELVELSWDWVAAGVNHSAAVTEEGQVYTWGNGECGRLGHGSNTDEPKPKLIKEGLEDVEIKRIRLCRCHTLALSSKGEVYSWGNNDYGQLGLGHTTSVGSPKLVKRLAEKELKVKDIQCGDAHSLFLTTEGEVYAAGGNYYGQLGLPDVPHRNVVPVPRRMRFPFAPRNSRSMKIKEVASGPTHNLAFSDDGDLFAWGYGRNGELGLNSRSASEAPRRVRSLDGTEPKALCAGNGFSLVVTGKKREKAAAEELTKEIRDEENLKAKLDSGSGVQASRDAKWQQAVEQEQLAAAAQADKKLEVFSEPGCQGVKYNTTSDKPLNFCTAKFDDGTAAKGKVRSVSVGMFTSISVYGGCKGGAGGKPLEKLATTMKRKCIDLASWAEAGSASASALRVSSTPSAPQPVGFFDTGDCQGSSMNWDTSEPIGLCSSKFANGVSTQNSVKSVTLGKYSVLAMLKGCGYPSEIAQVLISGDKDMCVDLPVGATVGYAVGEFLGAPAKDAPKGAGLYEGSSEDRHLSTKVEDKMLPTQNMTVEAWVKLYKFSAWGGIVSYIQADTTEEAGFLLGYRYNVPCFAIATEETGYLTYLAGNNAVLMPGTWHHVAATYDGSNMQIYLDGKLVRVGQFQSGPLKLPPKGYTPKRGGPLFTVGAFHDSNEYNPMVGMVAQPRVWGSVRSQADLARASREVLKGNEEGLLMNFAMTEETADGGFKDTAGRVPPLEPKGDVVLVNFSP